MAKKKVLTKREKVQEHLQQSQEQLVRLGRAMTVGVGKEILDLLTDMYYEGDMMGSSERDSAFKLGRRAVVDFLVGLRNDAMKE